MVFWPDTASVAQHMTDLAEVMQRRGFEIDVFSSRHGYEDSSIVYPATEVYDGFRINRIQTTGFGKKHVAGRISDFLSFNVALWFRLRGLRKKKYDLVVCTTSPPLVAYIAVKAARKAGIPFSYWAMDLQPELSIASGLIKEKTMSARVLTNMGNYIIRRCDSIIALDKYMKDYLIKRGGSGGDIHIVPVWPAMEEVYTGDRMENPFRRSEGFGDKIVVMYSGNHSYVHPLDTLLQTALDLRDDPKFLFVFIGGGVRKKDVTAFKEKNALTNIVQLPYQPRNNIHNSLGAADIQVVIMGNGQVGYTHPNKIYGAIFIGKPVLYIGPSPSHVSDILADLRGNIQVEHGASENLTSQLRAFGDLSAAAQQEIGKNNRDYAVAHFLPEVIKKDMGDILEEEIQKHQND